MRSSFARRHGVLAQLRRSLRRSSTRVALVVALAAAASAQNTWYVDASAAPNGNGSSWAQAFRDLDSALNAAQPGHEIWVAAGRYRPSPASAPNNPRLRSFTIPGDVRIYGGFDGTESYLFQRAGSFDRTVLDGDLGLPGVIGDNCFHVVKMRGGATSLYSILDGFVIQNGNAIGSGGGVGKGGGVSLDAGGNQWGPALELVNCTIRHNYADKGAGVAATNLAHVKFENSRVLDNFATTSGGGLYVMTSLVTSVNTEWARNTAGVDGGGAVFLTSTSSVSIFFQNNVFHDNRATLGGAVKLHATAFTKGDGHFETCTFASNSADRGGGLYVENGFGPKPELELYNSVLWGNSALNGAQIRGNGYAVHVEFCDVQGGFNGTGNIDQDPLFVDRAGGDLRLQAGSPAADAGNTNLIGADAMDLDQDGIVYERLPYDFDLRPRLTNDIRARNTGVAPANTQVVDMGAFEH